MGGRNRNSNYLSKRNRINNFNFAWPLEENTLKFNLYDKRWYKLIINIDLFIPLHFLAYFLKWIPQDQEDLQYLIDEQFEEFILLCFTILD